MACFVQFDFCDFFGCICILFLLFYIQQSVVQSVIQPLARSKLFWVNTVKQDVDICFLFVSE